MAASTMTSIATDAAARVSRERDPSTTAVAASPTRTPSHATTYHTWRSPEEIASIRKDLLAWYDTNHRKMPWRIHDTLDKDDARAKVAPDQRAYEVWVSEIMLQQTQVATVIPYYERWMAKWPTVRDLANATAEQVNELWSGLGYYSRASRLHGAAKLLVEKHEGKLPRDPADLKKHVPGVGPYTAGAIASIAYNVKAELVDGNVVRVYTRLRGIGGDPKSKNVDSLVWKLAGEAVPEDRPGAYNQALMDLGATICTPQNPSCDSCPISSSCLAYAEKKASDTQASTGFFASEKKEEPVPDIEDACTICPTTATPSDFSVTRYPLKVPKKKQREEDHLVVIAESDGKFLVVKRGEGGLLSGLWQFPMLETSVASSSKDDDDEEEEEKDEEQQEAKKPTIPSQTDNTSTLQSLLSPHLPSPTTLSLEFNQLGTVKHVFSHLIWNLRVYSCSLPSVIQPTSMDGMTRWLTEQEIESAALPTGMRKAFGLLNGKKKRKNKGGEDDDGEGKEGKKKKKGKGKEENVAMGKGQKGIESFFAKVL